LNGRIASYPFGAAFQGLAYDLADRLTTFSTATSKTLGYDKLDRLTSFVAGTTNLSYQYDADGNRTQFKNGTAISTYNNPTTSNRLSSITGTGAESYGYDAAGNITGLAGKTLTYDARGRLKTLTSGTSSWSYGINALGQRVTKAGTGFTGTLPFVYDEQGHLIGEYTSTGALTQETVYLGDTPIAILQGAATFYIQTDQLNTPRVILNASNQQRWRWDLNEPFGNNTPNENPASLGVFKYNLRFPGQYFDAETGLSQNYFRDYNPKIGRYIQSDPIGLAGGINTYAYVGGNPLKFVDLYGLEPKSTLGGDDPGFDNPEETIKDLEQQLKNPNLSQREKEKIKRRIRELRRKPSNKQQHHRESCEEEESSWWHDLFFRPKRDQNPLSPYAGDEKGSGSSSNPFGPLPMPVPAIP
jgi:RHS repeat-associated protein